MRKGKYGPLFWILLFGSVWGLAEVLIGGALSEGGVPLASAWLAVFALFILSVARGYWNRPGTSTAMGVIAALFKLINAAPFHCHLLGIVFLGVAFDTAASLIIRNNKKISFRHSLTGAAAAYGGFAFFALLVTYVIKQPYWVVGGFLKVLHHIFVSGSLAAVLAVALVPLGFWLGVNGGLWSEKSPRLAFSLALSAILVVWACGQIL